MPRRPRTLIPRDTPRRGEVVAALAIVVLLAHLLFAQLTLVLAIVFWAIARITTWRPHWLATPAVLGLLWALAIGIGRAAAGFVAGPGQVAAYLAGLPGSPGHLLHLSRAFAGLGSWLPRQLPFALIVAAAEVALLWWLNWLRTGEQDLQSSRPGLIVAARRRYATASIRSGGVVTRAGGCVGLDGATGRRAAISWPEAEGGVLCAGPDGTALAETGFLLACAAIRRRKAAIVIDLTGSQQLADSIAAVCAVAEAPLRRYGAPGPGCYEPLRGGDPARAASLVMAMVDWTGVSAQHRLACAGYLDDTFAVMAAAPADPRLPVLDDLARMLKPEALRARAARVPSSHPRREILTDRASISASLLAADLAAAAVLTAQLPRLRGSALGHWLRPAKAAAAAGEIAISLGQAVRDRAVVVFSLDRSVHGLSAGMIGSLAAADLLAVLTDLNGMAVRCDSLIWINGCTGNERRLATGLIRLGSATGTAVLSPPPMPSPRPLWPARRAPS